MFTIPTRTRAFRMAAATLVAAASIASAACSPAAPAPDPIPEGAPAYNNCPGSPCIMLAEVNTSGRTAIFRGETRYVSSPSQWFVTVSRDGVELASFESGALDGNRYDVDMGVFPAGGVYLLTILAGTPFGDQRMYKTFTTGPTVTATATATNVTLGFTMPVAVNATAYIRKTNDFLVATVNGSGPSATQSLVSAATLDPSTSYKFQIDATDAQGRFYRSFGTFTTRNVRLEVNLTGIQVNDDSDTFGAGELRAQLFVGNTTTWIWQTEKSVETAFGPKYFPLNISSALPSAVRSVPINIVVSDDDCEGIGSLCTSGTGDLSVGSGTTSDRQWATATTVANLPNTTTTTGFTQFIANSTGPIVFTVTGTYRWVMV